MRTTESTAEQAHASNGRTHPVTEPDTETGAGLGSRALWETTSPSGLLRVVAVALLVASLAILLITGPSAYAAAAAGLAIFHAIVLAMTRDRDAIEPIWGALIAAAWFLTTAVFVVFFGGLRGPAASGPLFVVCLASLLVGRKGLIVAAGATVALYVLELIIEQSGLHDHPADEVSFAEVVIVRFTLVVALTAALLLYFAMLQRIEKRQRSAEAARATTEEFFSRLLKDSPVMTVVTDVASKTPTYASPGFARRFGLGDDDLTHGASRDLWDLIHPEDQEQAQGNLHHFISSNGTEATRQSSRYKTTSGWRWMLADFSALTHHADGSLAQYAVALSDIDEQVEAEEYLRAVLNASPASVAVINLDDGTAEFASERFIELSGATLAEAQSSGSELWSRLVTQAEQGRLAEAAIEALDRDTVVTVRHQAGPDSTTRRWYRTQLTPFGGSHRRLLVTSLDIGSEVQAETVLDITPALVMIFDHATEVVEFMNPAYVEATGYTLADFNGFTMADVKTFMTDEERYALREARRAAMSGAASTQVLHRFNRADGTTRWFEVSFVPAPDGATRPNHLIMFGNDVTARIEAEAEVTLRQRILDVSPALFLLTRPDTQEIEYANPAYIEATGQSREGLQELINSRQIGTRWFDEDRPKVAAAYTETLATGEPRTVLYRFKRSESDVRWFSATFTRFGGGDTAMPARMLLSGTDVTDRIEAERFSSTVLESSPALTVVLDASTGQTLFASPSFEHATGHTAESLNAMEPDEMRELTPQGHRDLVDDAISSALATGSVVALERPYRSADGTVRWYDSRFARVSGAEDSRVVISAVDVTERRVALEALREERAALARANRDLNDFVHIASHDLQEPLRSVAAFTELLANELPDDIDDDLQAAVRFANDGATRMRRLVSGLSAYSRIGANRVEGKVDLQEVADDVRADFDDLINRTGASVIATDLATVHGDRTELQLVLRNLIANAIKFGPADTAPIVRVSSATTDDGWRIEVADNGIGIEPEYHQRIFRIFQRLHADEDYEGTGIGLAHCKRAIENHGGAIGVVSEMGNGSTFWFTLPRITEKDRP